ncbi:hypothetical protein HGRIS_005970 [Hohenbuehelia grisea]|uniref:Rad60/SUMO-like domain-containing protein n=1 Tax=Hohenbuehelia grisea TaxID=104357 RepID=A0ABR3K0V4_9AGAR
MAPRPRPRPKAVQRTVSSPAPPTTNASSSSSVTTKAVIDVDDDDEMFMKNRSRSAKTWRQLDQRDEALDARAPRRNSSDDEGHSDGSPRSRKQKKKTNDAQPKWQREQDMARFLSEGLSDHDSDTDGVEVVEGAGASTLGASKRKRARSRSRSITPPPALPIYQVQYARSLVRQTLKTAPRPDSPTNFDPDESTDTIILAPELQNIVKIVKAQSNARLSSPVAPSSEALDKDSKADTDTIMLTVRWLPHPLNTADKPQVWTFKVNRTKSFHVLFDEVADRAGVLTDSLRVSFNGKRIFSSVTPAGLHMFVQAELEACNNVTFEYLRSPAAAAAARPPSPDVEIEGHSDGKGSPAHSRQPSAAPASYSKDDDSDNESTAGDTFKLILRSVLTQDREISLTVKPTTTCGAIVKAFLKKAGLLDRYPRAGESSGPTKAANPKRKGAKAKAPVVEKDPRLFIDGEKMDNGTEISEADLEDGDLIEVTGL